jgi:hypothetical protein
VHLDQDVAGEELPRRDRLLPLLHLGDFFGRHDDLPEVILEFDALIIFWMFSRTLFSWPEYVCTTYQRMGRVETPRMPRSLPDCDARRYLSF